LEVTKATQYTKVEIITVT